MILDKIVRSKVLVTNEVVHLVEKILSSQACDDHGVGGGS